MNKETEIIKEWDTSEINPLEIAETLNGDLVVNDIRENFGTDWSINFDHGYPDPIISILGNSTNRRLALTLNAPTDPGEGNAYLGSTLLDNVWKLQFLKFREYKRGPVHTSMIVMSKDPNGEGPILGSFQVSDKFHR